MSKTVLVLISIVAFASCSFIRSHNYWFTPLKEIVKTEFDKAESAWNFCDLKCLYLEKYYPKYDFVFMTFSQIVYAFKVQVQKGSDIKKPNFGACYIKIDVHGGKTYKLWNTVAKNTYFYTYCGQESEDYYYDTFSHIFGYYPLYKIESIEGEGIGAEADY